MYFGSVRFFKNMILVAVIIMIAIPTVCAILLQGKLNRQTSEIVQLSSGLTSAQEQIASLSVQISELQANESESSDYASPDPLPYQQMYPDFYAPQEYCAEQREVGTIYLTFDDGPSRNTDRILDILAEENVKATFFVTGIAETDEIGYQRMRNIVDQGHTLGMHSYTHEYDAIYSSVEAFLDDMYLVFTQIQSATGVTPTVFRFPGGSINGHNPGIYQELIAEMIRRGFVPFDWNLSSQDAAGTLLSSDEIVQNVVGNAGRIERGFVLMHDSASRTTTADALSPMIDRLRDLGFQFDCIKPETKPVLFGYRDQVVK